MQLVCIRVEKVVSWTVPTNGVGEETGGPLRELHYRPNETPS